MAEPEFYAERGKPFPPPDPLPPCPQCGGELRIELRMMATNALLGGTGLKVGVKLWPHIVCSTCDFVEAGEYA